MPKIKKKMNKFLLKILKLIIHSSKFLIIFLSLYSISCDDGSNINWKIVELVLKGLTLMYMFRFSAFALKKDVQELIDKIYEDKNFEDENGGGE